MKNTKRTNKGTYRKEYYEANKEKMMENQRKWKEKNPDYHYQYQCEHMDKFVKATEKWLKKPENKGRYDECRKEYCKVYYEKNKDYICAMNRLRRKMKKWQLMDKKTKKK